MRRLRVLPRVRVRIRVEVSYPNPSLPNVDEPPARPLGLVNPNPDLPRVDKPPARPLAGGYPQHWPILAVDQREARAPPSLAAAPRRVSLLQIARAAADREPLVARHPVYVRVCMRVPHREVVHTYGFESPAILATFHSGSVAKHCTAHTKSRAWRVHTSPALGVHVHAPRQPRPERLRRPGQAPCVHVCMAVKVCT